VPVGDGEIDSTLEIMRKQRATYEDVARGATEGDVVVVDFKGSIDGVPFDGGTANDFVFTVGQGRMLPEFEAAVVGMTAGSTKTFPLTFRPITRRQPRRQGRRVRGHREEGSAAGVAGAGFGVRTRHLALPMATWTRCGRK